MNAAGNDQAVDADSLGAGDIRAQAVADGEDAAERLGGAISAGPTPAKLRLLPELRKTP
jgi:hypothetical protein